MRHVPALVFALAVLPLAADTTGRVAGKVTTKDGKPVASAKVTLSRVDINWKKELKTNASGSYMQIGLEPREYDLEVSAEGFVSHKERFRVPLGDVLNVNVTLLTAAESAQAGGGAVAATPADPGAGLDQTGSEAFNEAVTLFNEQKYAEALPLVELAYQNLQESLEKTTDEGAKADVEKKIERVGRTYGITLFEVGIASEAKKDLLVKAKPFLEKDFEKDPKNGRTVDRLLRLSKAQHDKEGEKKYQALMDAIIGPQAQVPYNEAVNAFNAGHVKEAKEHALKAIATDPKFADSYWLMGVLEFSLNNLPGAKSNLRKYLELAPNGAKAGEVKEMLKELK